MGLRRGKAPVTLELPTGAHETGGAVSELAGEQEDRDCPARGESAGRVRFSQWQREDHERAGRGDGRCEAGRNWGGRRC